MTTSQDQANTMRQIAETARILVVELGFDKGAALKAVCDGDLSKLAG